MDTDGAVECAHCGLRQRFDTEQWRGALAFAHSVADLAAPGKEGRNPHPEIWIGSDNPYALIGEHEVFARYAGDSFSVEASSGYPVCDHCHEPYHIRQGEQGMLEALCPSCGNRPTYALPPSAHDLYGGLLGVVADDQRTDRPSAKVTLTAAGIMALNCPSCGGQLTITQPSSVQTCSYCRASCFVPHRSLSRALSRTVKPAIWWAFFRGVSPTRAELVLGAPETAENTKAALLEKLKRKKGKTPPQAQDRPGVYEAPELAGRNWPQVWLTVLAGSVAAAIGYVITRAL
jgi:hypothetical protein